MEMPKAEPDFPPEPDSAPVKLPSSTEFHDFFTEFLYAWLKLSSQNIVGIGDEIPNLPMERGLQFSKPFNGILVIRTMPEFEGYLQKAAHIDPSAHREMFVELFVLFWHKFVSKFWGLDSRKLPPSLFKKSIPLDWPNRKPDALIQVFVGNYPVGVRFWANLTEEEMSHWREPKQ